MFSEEALRDRVPLNRLVNEAVGEYLDTRSATVEAELEETLRRVKSSGLPPAIRLRPRPDGGYGDAGAAAMNGDGPYGLSSFASAPVATSRRSSSPGAGY